MFRPGCPKQHHESTKISHEEPRELVDRLGALPEASEHMLHVATSIAQACGTAPARPGTSSQAGAAVSEGCGGVAQKMTQKQSLLMTPPNSSGTAALEPVHIMPVLDGAGRAPKPDIVTRGGSRNVRQSENPTSDVSCKHRRLEEAPPTRVQAILCPTPLANLAEAAQRSVEQRLAHESQVTQKTHMGTHKHGPPNGLPVTIATVDQSAAHSQARGRCWHHPPRLEQRLNNLQGFGAMSLSVLNTAAGQDSANLVDRAALCDDGRQPELLQVLTHDRGHEPASFPQVLHMRRAAP